jgi:DNA-binding transcriptional ArsR family regulator
LPFLARLPTSHLALIHKFRWHGPAGNYSTLGSELLCMLIYVTTQIQREPDENQVEVAVDMFKLLADSTRLRIVWTLLHGEHSVNELADHLGLNPAGVSQHLARLRLARLVRVRREGNRAFYAAESTHVRQLAEQALFHTDHVVGGVIQHVDEPESSPARIETKSRGGRRASHR